MTLEKSLYCPETNNSFFVPNTVVYAGGSSRRAAFLRHCFPRQDLEVVPIGDEPEIPDVLKIAEYKLHEGLSKRSLVYGEIMIASDTRTQVPSLDSAGNISLTSKGKPINVNQIFQYAKNVVQIADKGINPYYRVDSGTVMGVYNGSLRLKRIQDLSLISFNLGVGELATERGFLNYLMAFDRFYESEPYQKNGMEGIKPTDFSAGFSLPVFVQMGLIESINGIKPGSPIFKTVLAHTVHSAAVGISLSLMEECGISIERQTNEWPWLQSVSENALSGINNNEKH